jgi:hypothetical protein
MLFNHIVWLSEPVNVAKNERAANLFVRRLDHQWETALCCLSKLEATPSLLGGLACLVIIDPPLFSVGQQALLSDILSAETLQVAVLLVVFTLELFKLVGRTDIGAKGVSPGSSHRDLMDLLPL